MMVANPANPYESPPPLADLPAVAPPARAGLALMLVGAAFAVANLLTFLSIGVREILVYFDPIPALAIYLGGFVAGMVLIPAMAGHLGSPIWRAGLLFVLIVLEIFWMFNVFVGAFCRGPNWNFFWPWEDRDEFRVVAINNVNLSEYFWHWLGFAARPESWLVREMPGFALLAIWLLILPLVAARLLRTNWPQQTPAYWRCFAAGAFVQGMALLPLKMLLRTAYNLKYFVDLPEFTLHV